MDVEGTKKRPSRSTPILSAVAPTAARGRAATALPRAKAAAARAGGRRVALSYPSGEGADPLEAPSTSTSKGPWKRRSPEAVASDTTYQCFAKAEAPSSTNR